MAANYKLETETTEIDSIVETQLADYVTRIASMYRENPFRSFEHASHVAVRA